MSEDALFVLAGAAARIAAKRLIDQAPTNTRVAFQGPKRTLPQNTKMQAMLTDIARQKRWHGQKLHKDDWKLIFMAGLDGELRLVPNLAGDGFVPLGRRSSGLSKKLMSDMIELMYAWGSEQDPPVQFHDEIAAIGSGSAKNAPEASA